LSDLTEWLEIAQRASGQDRKYVQRLAEFVTEGAKERNQTAGEFLEYLDYYQQANCVISLNDDEAPVTRCS